MSEKKNLPKDTPEVPEELGSLLTEEFMKEWMTYNEKQQLFLVTWMSNGFHAADAWMKAYQYPEDRMYVASAAASRFLASDKVKKIRELISAAIYQPLERAMQVENEALNAFDWNVKLKAAKQIRERQQKISPFKINPADGGTTNVQINNYNVSNTVLDSLLNSNSKGR